MPPHGVRFVVSLTTGFARLPCGNMQAIGMSATETVPLRAHDLHDVVGWIDARVRDATGRHLGRVRAVFSDASGTPWWILVRHRGRDLVAPVGAVYDTRHRQLLLDRAAETLAAGPREIGEREHRALLDRFGIQV